jgi:predicted NBD/HSP70 family sugar kinase
MLEPNPILAIDLGATNLRCALVGEGGVLLRRRAIATPFNDTLPSALVQLARDVQGSTEVRGCVAGVPGRVDYQRGGLEWGRGHPASWARYLSNEWLTVQLGTPVRVANDADLAAVGETYFGAGDQSANVVYLTVSTGLGSAAVLRGRLLRTRVSAVEIGLTWTGLPTAVGETEDAHVLEDLASGRGLRDSARRLGWEAHAPEIVAMATAGDTDAASLWDGLCRAAGLAAVNLAHVLIPEIIVLGGGISRVGEAFRARVEEAVVAYGPQGLPEPIHVRLAALGDDAGLNGAAAWSRALGVPPGGPA